LVEVASGVGWGRALDSSEAAVGAEAAGAQAARATVPPAAAASFKNLRRLILTPLVWFDRVIVIAHCGRRSG
jgi:hypothetical protein